MTQREWKEDGGQKIERWGIENCKMKKRSRRRSPPLQFAIFILHFAIFNSPTLYLLSSIFFRQSAISNPQSAGLIDKPLAEV